MKRIIASLFLALFLFLPQTVSAQEPGNFKEAFLQLNLRVEDYNKAHDEYVLRRSQYMRFKSLQSEQDARAATAELLRRRDDVVIAYLKSLQLRLAETVGITAEARSTMEIRITEEIAFFTDHKANVPSAGSLQDLVADSNKAQARYLAADDLFYNALFVMSDGKMNDFQTRTNELLTKIKLKVESIRNEQREEYMLPQAKIDSIDRFIFESENKLVRSQEKQSEANVTVVGRLYSAQDYSARLAVLGQSQSYLREVTSFLKEIVSQMKSKE